MLIAVEGSKFRDTEGRVELLSIGHAQNSAERQNFNWISAGLFFNKIAIGVCIIMFGCTYICIFVKTLHLLYTSSEKCLQPLT